MRINFFHQFIFKQMASSGNIFVAQMFHRNKPLLFPIIMAYNFDGTHFNHFKFTTQPWRVASTFNPASNSKKSPGNATSSKQNVSPMGRGKFLLHVCFLLNPPDFAKSSFLCTVNMQNC